MRHMKRPRKIREEFLRITNKDLIDNFRAAINQHTPRLLKLYRARRTALPPEMDQLLNRLDKETSHITAHRQTTALKGLPLCLCDSHEKLFRNCLATDPEEEQTKGLIVGILTVLEDDDSSAPATVINVAVVVEENDIVLQDLHDVPAAFAYLFGLIYTLNLQYPKELSPWTLQEPMPGILFGDFSSAFNIIIIIIIIIFIIILALLWDTSPS
ncbi:uncharacterized protein LOC119488526 [Sebastes umbrosus]|uniref:uncharacterized protein LOC119488526 n=1 Tax=Sebastes umbrosus TaxID=72105 RepID=UPI0018A02B01|nr:uncharacterized protein LOC119488526 [Sebastes umbrosus]